MSSSFYFEILEFIGQLKFKALKAKKIPISNFNVKMVAFSSVISHCCEQIFIDARLKATIESSHQKAIFQFANILRSILIAIDRPSHRRHFDSEYVNLFVRLPVIRTFDLQPHSTSSWLPEFDRSFQSLKSKIWFSPQRKSHVQL